MTPREILSASAVVPVMAIDDLSTAVDLAHALVAGGIPTLEITLRTPVGLDAIRLIKKRQDEVLTVYVFKRIVRFFAADEAAVTK